MRVDVSKLREISEKLFSHLENSGLDPIELGEDFYWNIPEEEKYDMETSPKELDVGQLTEDWEFLQSALEPNRETLRYTFIWFGKILEAIGERVVK